MNSCDPKLTLPYHPSYQIFADWLVDTYGVERLTSGGGICDVAGGHGDVSVRLWIDHGIPCTIIDPRNVGFKKR